MTEKNDLGEFKIRDLKAEAFDIHNQMIKKNDEYNKLQQMYIQKTEEIVNAEKELKEKSDK